MKAHHKKALPNQLRSSLTAIGVTGLMAVPMVLFAIVTRPLAQAPPDGLAMSAEPDTATVTEPVDPDEGLSINPIEREAFGPALIRTSQLDQVDLTVTTEIGGANQSTLMLRIEGDNWSGSINAAGQPRRGATVVGSVMFVPTEGRWMALPILDESDFGDGVRATLAETEHLGTLPMLKQSEGDTEIVYTVDCETLLGGDESGSWADECAAGAELEVTVDLSLGVVNRLVRRTISESAVGVITQTVTTVDLAPVNSTYPIEPPPGANWTGYLCLATKLGVDPDDPIAMNNAVNDDPSTRGLDTEGLINLSHTCE